MVVNKEIWSAVKKHFADFNEITQAKVVGFTEHLDIEAEDINDVSISDDECTFEIHGGEYLVCTDEEADEKSKEEITQLLWAFNTDFIAGHVPKHINASMIDACKGRYEDSNDDILELIKAGTGIDKFVEEAIAADGRGHNLDTYSGDEEEIRVDCRGSSTTTSCGFDFYIYRRF